MKTLLIALILALGLAGCEGDTAESCATRTQAADASASIERSCTKTPTD